VIGGNARRRDGDKRREMTQGVGLSVGATNVAAVAGGAAATRQSVLTLYRHRPPEVGVPSENPRLAERGLVVTGFVDRSGDPVGVLAADGSFHRGEVLVADALCALTRNVSCRRPAVPPAVTYPAHWRPAAVEGLRRELAKRPEWSGAQPLTLVSDAAAALTALQAEPGLPTRGVVALCDFGGTGTTITLADASNGYRSIGAAVRNTDFSGELVDRAVMAHVIADLSNAGTVDVAGTAAIGSLQRLRAECRAAKERLSRGAVTTLFADVPGFRGDVRLTRSELDDEIRQPLAAFLDALRELLFRNRIHPADLTAVATMGGGANIPAVTTALSEQLRVPVITGRHPEVTAARGAALRAVRRPEDDSLTVAASPVGSTPQSATLRALAWSEIDDVPDITPMAIRSVAPQAGGSPRPRVRFVHDEPARVTSSGQPWYRPVLVTAGVFAAMLFVGTGAVLALRNDASAMTGPATSTTTVAPEPITQAAAPPADQPPAEVPSAPSFIQAPAPATRVIEAAPPPVIAMAAPAPAAIAPPPPAAPPPPQDDPPLPPPPTDTTPSTPTTTPPPPPSSTPPSPPSSTPPSETKPSTPPSHEDPAPPKDTPPAKGDTTAPKSDTPPAKGDTPTPEPAPAKPADQPK
jgi:hypothetical protein